ASRAHFGALAEMRSLQLKYSESQKVRDREGAIASTRGACAPRKHTYLCFNVRRTFCSFTDIIAGELDAVDTTTYFR
ncbi:MAG: hypothetical protein ACJ8LV_06350, partial [Chthoniobacterales bacterium]